MRSALKRAGIALAGALLATSVATTPAYAEPAALTGTVTSDTTGDPVPACVHVVDPDYNGVGFTCTEDGSWSIDGLESGVDYRVLVWPNGGPYVEEWAQNASSFETADVVNAPATVDVSLAPAGTISGTLTLADGTPASDVSVRLWAVGADSPSQSAYVDGGSWFAQVPEGDYQVEFVDLPRHQWATGAATRDEAAIFHVSPAEPVTVDDVLMRDDPESLSGRVTAADTGEPLDACVYVYTAETYDWVGGSCTGESGTEQAGEWVMYGLPEGEAYKVEVDVTDETYLDEWIDGADSFEDARQFVTPAVADASVEHGAVIRGTLLRADGQPAADAWVATEPATAGGTYESTATSESGEWSLVVREGDYRVQFYVMPESQWAYGTTDRAAATIFHATADSDTVVDDTLLAPSTIAGVIRADATGQPVAGACADVLITTEHGDLDVATGCADESGRYSVDVAPGTYTVRFYDPSHTHAPEYHTNATTPEQASSLTVARGQTVVADASLGAAAVLTGTVVDARTGAPVEGACPDAFWGNAGQLVSRIDGSCSDAAGRWSLRGLPTGAFAVRFSTAWHNPTYAETWAYKSTTQDEAQLIAVTGGSSVTTRNVKLQLGGMVSGTITDAFGNPVSGAWVDLDGSIPWGAGGGEGRFVAHTDEAGHYAITGVPEGDYRPVVYSDWETDFAPEWSGDADTIALAEPVSVKTAKTSSFDAVVAPGGKLTGSVVDASGNPTPAHISVEVYDIAGKVVGVFFWNGEHFTGTELPGGDVRMKLHNWETGDEWWYDGASSPVDATVVHLERGEPVDITFHLP